MLFFIWWKLKKVCIFTKTKTNIMKNLLSNIAIKLVESNFSNDTIQVCGAILKQSFMEQGFDRATSNEFAIDALKITMQTLKDLV